MEGHRLLILPSSPPPPGLLLRQKILSQTEPGKRDIEGMSNILCLNTFDTSTISHLKNDNQKTIKCINCIYRVPSESFASLDPGTQTLKLEETSPLTPSTPSPDSPSHSSGQPNSPAESSGCSLSPQLKVCMFINYLSVHIIII